MGRVVDGGDVEAAWATRLDGWVVWEAEDGVAAWRPNLLFSFVPYHISVQGSHIVLRAQRTLR
jgi:hypothetical protein